MEVKIELVNISAYPNPCTEELKVSFDSSTPVQQVSLFDLQGNHLWDQEVASTKGKTFIPVKNYPTGIYFLSVSGPKASRIVKIIKQ